MAQAVVTSTDVIDISTCIESPQDKNATQMDKARWSRTNGNKHHRGRFGHQGKCSLKSEKGRPSAPGADS